MLLIASIHRINSCWLLVVGCWLLVVGCWLLVVGCWLLVVGCWLLVVGCRPVAPVDETMGQTRAVSVVLVS
jgi:hypothetical protein